MTTPDGQGINTDDRPITIPFWYVTGNDDSIPGLANRSQDVITTTLQNFVKGSPNFQASSQALWEGLGLRPGIPLPAAIIEWLMNALGLGGIYTSMQHMFDDLSSWATALPTVDELLGLVRALIESIFGGGANTDPGLPYTLPFTLAKGSTVATFFTNLRAFFGDIGFSDADFDLIAAIEAFVTDVLMPTDLLATSQSLQDLLDTIWQAITDSTRIDNLLSDLTDALKNIPALNVLGIGGPTDIGSTVQSTWDQWIGGLVGAIGSGAGLSDLFNIGQDVSSRATLGQFSWDILGIRSNKSLNTGLLPTSESNFGLDKVALTGSAPTFALTQSTAITAFQRISESASKGVVSWLGSGVTNITHCFVNVYRMDPATGGMTLVHASANIIGNLSGTMQYNIYTLPTPIDVTASEVYGIEIAVRGTGTHSIVGSSTWLPDHSSVYPRRLSAVRNSGTSAAPSTIASGSVAYASNVPFIEFGVTSGDVSIPHSPQTILFNAAGSSSIPIPSWANFVEVIALGGGGGGHIGGTWGIGGEGGDNAAWQTTTWLRGTDFTGSPSISLTVGAGGAGSATAGLSGNGATGKNTTVSISGHSLTSVGGVGANSFDIAGSEHVGESAGSVTYQGRTYVGGAAQNTYGATGSAPGGGGAGGNWVSFQAGGSGAPGAVWIVFRQT